MPLLQVTATQFCFLHYYGNSSHADSYLKFRYQQERLYLEKIRILVSRTLYVDFLAEICTQSYFFQDLHTNIIGPLNSLGNGQFLIFLLHPFPNFVYFPHGNRFSTFHLYRLLWSGNFYFVITLQPIYTVYLDSCTHFNHMFEIPTDNYIVVLSLFPALHLFLVPPALYPVSIVFVNELNQRQT